MSENIQAIMFDFDGVLADTEPLHWECWNQALAPLRLNVSWEDYRQHCVGISDKDFLIQLGALGRPPRLLDELWPYYPLKKELFASRATNGGLIPAEMKELLNELRELPLAVVTSSTRQEIEAILKAEKVLHLFRAAVYGDEVRRLKPDPEPYRMALERLGVRRALVLEDSAAGVDSARGAGCEVLVVSEARQAAALLRKRLAGADMIVPGIDIM